VPNSIQYAYACEEGDIQHWTNLLITPSRVIEHSTESSMSGQFLLPIPTMGSEIISNDSTKQKTVDRLNELGYFVDESNPRPVATSDIQSVVLDLRSGYSTICKNGIMQVVGGMLLQPDSATLLIAYGIANSIWIVPSVAGIGIAVYLVKRRF